MQGGAIRHSYQKVEANDRGRPLSEVDDSNFIVVKRARVSDDDLTDYRVVVEDLSVQAMSMKAGKVDELENAVHELKKENGVLKQQIGALQQENGKLKQQIGVLQQENGGLKQQIGVLQQENGKLKQQIETVMNEIGTLKQKTLALENALEDHKKETKEKIKAQQRAFIDTIRAFSNAAALFE